MGDGVAALILLIAFFASAILFARRRSSQIDDIERGLPAELRGVDIAWWPGWTAHTGHQRGFSLSS
jgi:hypothetical protein